jgi:hypothetical protein
MVIVATFDELMLRNDVCLLSFSEIRTWIKNNVKHSWKVWRIKEVDWGSSLSVSHVLHQATTSLMAQRWKEIKGDTFWTLDSDCRKAPSCDGRHSRIRSQIGVFKYFLEPWWSHLSYGSSLKSISNRRRPQSSKHWPDVNLFHVLRHLIWPNGPCIKLGPLRTCPRVRGRPQHPFGHPPMSSYCPIGATNSWGFCLDQV